MVSILRACIWWSYAFLYYNRDKPLIKKNALQLITPSVMPNICWFQWFAINSFILFLLHLYSSLLYPHLEICFPPHLTRLTSLQTMHPQVPSDPFLLAWSLCPALQLLCHPVSGPSVNVHSANFPSPVSAHNYLAAWAAACLFSASQLLSGQQILTGQLSADVLGCF